MDNFQIVFLSFIIGGIFGALCVWSLSIILDHRSSRIDRILEANQKPMWSMTTNTPTPTTVASGTTSMGGTNVVHWQFPPDQDGMAGTPVKR